MKDIFQQIRNLRRSNPFKLVNFLPNPKLQYKALDRIFNFVIPFNRGLGIQIKSLSADEVIVEFPPTKRRLNHVGTTHAVALALIGEYPAGLLVAQKFSFETYRIIIGKLEIIYEKPGMGLLTAVASAPREWPLISLDGEAWVDLETIIRNAKNEVVARIKTKWQIKEWSKTKHRN